MVKRIGAIILVITTVFLLSTALAEGSAMPESSATVSTAAPENQASGDELVYNGDFSMTDDDGAPLGWIYDIWNTGVTNFEVVNDAQRGSCLYIDSAGENDAKALCELEVEPSSYYRLTCYVKAEEISADTDGANLSIFNTFTRSAAVYDTDGGWQQLVLTGKTGETQTTIQLAVRIGGYGSLASGKAWFTGVTMVRLDGEPAGEYADFATLPASDDENNNSDEEEAAEDTNYDILPGMTTILVSGIVTLALFIFVYRKFIVAPRRGQKNQFERIAIIFILAVMARLILSLLLVGHDTDLGCFLAWSQTVARTGFSGFYTSGVFADYTPGYMYVLWLLGLIPKLTGLSYGGWLYIFIIKLPAIACDLISAYLIYKLAKPRFGERVALGLLTLFALNPVAMFISGGWGQIDSIVALLMLLCFEAFAIKKKKILAAVIYGLAVLIKPQALMFGPLLAVAYIKDMLTEDKKQWWKTPAAVVAAVATIYLLALPFQGTQEPGWILERYFSTATSYAYASIEAFNFFALIGANWKPVTDTILGIPYIVFGSVFIVLSATAGAILYCKAKDKTKRVLVLCAAFSMAAMYTFGQYMHERYIFVILLLLAVAFISYNDKRLFKSLMLFSITAMLNSAGAFQIVVYQTRGIEYQILTYAVSALEVGAFIYFAIACFDILIRGHIKEPRVEEAPMAKQLTECLPPLEKTDTKLNFTLRDKLLCCALTAVYAVIALIGLGTTTAPETYWRSDGRYQTITFTFDEGTKLNNIWMFNGLGSDANVEFISGDVTVGKMEQSYSNVYRWETLEVDFEGTQLTMEASGSDVWINELVFWGADGTRVQPLSIEKTDGVLEETDAKSDVLHLCDEPNEVPEEISYLYETYFDEIYHARTAYEHLNGLSVFEISHPPLGKVLIMTGIAVFGMNTFGWRIVGTLFGIAMVPLMYCFGKRLFKKTPLALLTSVLFTFDFMHFTQTRIATVDVYGVFFILLMFYYMYQYFSMNFFTDGLKRTLKPLGLAGIFFGLGAASKWICLYAGGGLALILLASFFKRWREYRYMKKLEEPDEVQQRYIDAFVPNIIKTLAFCVVFFIIIPVAIYILSYLPYMLMKENPYTLADVWKNQLYMYSYHSGLKATHPFQSPWWQWPVIGRPILYYVDYTKTSQGLLTTMSAFGNPLVWWGSLVGTIALVTLLIRRRVKMSPGIFLVLVGIAANFIPWTLVSRCVFIYHYFATVPFIIFALVYAVKYLEEDDERYRWVKYALMIGTVLLFAAFYPAIAGVTAPTAYIKLLQWMPSWTFGA